MTRKFNPQSLSNPTSAVIETYNVNDVHDRELVWSLSKHCFDLERGLIEDFEEGYKVFLKLRDRIGLNVAKNLFDELTANVARSVAWMRAQPVGK